MADEGAPNAHLAGPQNAGSPPRGRRRSRYQADTSSGLASEEAEAERRGIEAAEAGLPRQTRGLKLNYADVINERRPIGEQDLQGPVPLHTDLASIPGPLTSRFPQSNFSVEQEESGDIPLFLYKGQKTPQGTKRIKGVSVERAFIIGSQAWALDESNKPAGTPADHTKGWKVYVKGTENGPDITTWLKKVQFKLHHTYANNTRTVESPPFEINETGWGGFQVEIRLFFVPEANEKPQWRSHLLQLEPYGSDADIQAQKDKNLVVAEVCDFVDFNEPVEPFFAKLTSEAQFAYMDKARGKGKNRQPPTMIPREERSAQLPERSTPTNQFSKEAENAILDMLRKARGNVMEQIEEEKRKAADRQKEIKELQESGDFQQQTRRR